MTIRLCLIASLATLFATSSSLPAEKYLAVKQLALKQPFHTKSDWNVTAYQATGPDAFEGDIPVKICFSRGGHEDCTLITSRAEDGTLVFNHQTVSELTVVELTPKENGVLLNAQFSGGGSGLLNQIAIWSYERTGDYFQRILTMSLTEQGSYQLIATGPLQGDAISADYVWDQGEAHFDGHRYAISVNHYIGSGPHGEILRYVTRQKYGGENSLGGRVKVINAELPRINQLLRNLYGH